MKNAWVMGDLHGDVFPVRNFYTNHKDELSEDPDKNLLILLGDVGANYYLNERDGQFKNKLEKLPFTYFCIRGNHEERPTKIIKKNQERWHMEYRFGNIVYVENAHPRILYALDEGGKYIINGKSVLVIPGAYSVDKYYRLSRGWSWFENEQLYDFEKENILNSLEPHYNYILTHTCPVNWQSYLSDLFLSQVDQLTIDNSTEKFLQEVSDNTFWDHWYFGHYHNDRDISYQKATMLFHNAVPLGLSLADYQRKSFDNF